jgi:KipI family sensor histidine kinase inhibitor
VAESLRGRVPELLDVVAAYETVGLYFDEPLVPGRIEAALDQDPEGESASVMHEIPVCYGLGEDRGEVCERLGVSEAELVARHSEQPYRCAAVGFKPGFAYLGDLTEEIAGLPRRPTPRVRVAAGSVGITGRQTAVYPCECPGGWWLIGKTPLIVADPDTDFFPIAAGDEVRFVPIDVARFQELEGSRL